MKKIILYQISILFAICLIWVQSPLNNFPVWLKEYELAIKCILIATLAGILYSLRAIYVNYSACKNWDNSWEVWYYLRPITSSISGLVAYIFLKASLIILETSQVENAGNYGYLAFAFIAGLNVDKFLKKIEAQAKSSFGVETSRASRMGEDDN